MARPQFVDRDDELDLLRSRFERDDSDLVVIYGRRRLGKSALVREAIAERDDAVYWQATEETPDAQLANFLDTASETFPLLEDIQRDWEALLRALGREDAIVVLDEFPYLVESDDALPSKVQRVWDLDLEETGMTLVLVGSSISIMEEKVLSGGSPLYGRRTATIDLSPLALDDARELYPSDDPDEIIQTWGVFGGTPYYLRALSDDASLGENIQAQVLSEHGVLHTEPEFLLRTEFGIREPQTYYTVLRAIATGRRAANEIADFAGVDSNALGSYLSKLRRLRLVERDIPVTANPNATRKSRYRLREPLFRFWFRYVYGQEEKITQLGEDAYDELVAPSFTEYMGAMFELVCQNALPDLVPKTYRGIGYWWHSQDELDVVGLASDGTLVAGECKYTTREMHEGDLADLERGAAQVDWTPPAGGDPDYHYCCFCRSGFSEGLQQTAEARDDVSLFTPDDIVGDR
ncbi:ATPase (AAA+ superfamily) protein [Halorubrum californiense DSM 19288]|uniref:ATPase (AAA+ superfamily) protein n=1 Tax=Halorubrum californiense DSM 19288 TaxID=1227465 RepID=M0DZC7_9EURY|nr:MULTISPECIES: ATP-binding protein [Halorubrum]ELZ40032.1 ATPase (AAA+ superfamily) protein [Halorubrum californiense DSM 19288]TKX73245.1 ATP-binding protein [Halorubrum sp. GN11GM_10-3_MGM]